MKLTYMIGNGFDIGLGFNTRYVDFVGFLVKELEEYLHPGRPGVSDSDRNFGMWLLEQIRDHKQEFWSDAEVAFGGLPFSNCGGAVVDVVKYSHDRFLGSMSRWLNHEIERGKWPEMRGSDVSCDFVRNCVFGWMSGVSELQKQKFADCIDGGVLELNFITFNYTNVCKRLLSGLGDVSNSTICCDHNMNVRLGRVCHVQGILSKTGEFGNLVFGVNDGDQIKDSGAKSHIEVSARLIKGHYISYAELGIYEEARRLIHDSDYVITYGLSFGATDSFWWKQLHSYVHDQSKHLVICPFIKPYEIGISKDMIRYKQWMFNKVFGSLDEISRNAVLRPEILSQIITVTPVKVQENNGDMILCDYLQLHSIARKLWIGG